MITTEPYLLSFTSAYLSHNKSRTLAQAYNSAGTWDAVEERLLTDNLLQTRTNNAAIRIYRELVPRLKMLSADQMNLLIQGNYLEQKHMLWLAICKRYRYIQEFAIEVVREKFLRMDYQLTDLDYISFFNRKADWHPELEEITEKTQEKLRQVIFRTLKDVEILTKDNNIVQSIFTENEKEVLLPDAPLSFQIFPILFSEVPRKSDNE